MTKRGTKTVHVATSIRIAMTAWPHKSGGGPHSLPNYSRNWTQMPLHPNVEHPPFLIHPHMKTFLVAQSVGILLTMQETWVRFWGQEDPLEKEMAAHSGILVFLPGKFHGQRSLMGYSPRCRLVVRPFPHLSIIINTPNATSSSLVLSKEQRFKDTTLNPPHRAM